MKVLTEAATAIKAPSGRWRAILAVPGQGSSGKYSAEMLQRFGPAAFPAGMKAYINHDEKRDPRDLLGTYPEGAFWDAEHGEEGALVSELLPLPRYADFVNEVAPHVGLSIFAMGKDDGEGNITELVYDRMNGVDMVGYGGLEGSGLAEKLSERATTLLEIARTAALAFEREKDSMTPEQIMAKMAEILAPLTAFVVEQQRAEAARVAAEADVAPAPTAEEAVAKFALASTSVREAKLLPRQEAALLAAAAKGEDITAAVEDAKAIRDEATKFVTESAPAGGRRAEAAASGASEDYSLGMDWK